MTSANGSNQENGRRRAAAAASLICAAGAAILGLEIVVTEFPRGLIVLAGVAIAQAAAWLGLIRTGAGRLLGVAIAALALAGLVVFLIVDGDHLVEAIAIVLALGLAAAATGVAYRVHAALEPAPDPTRPVLFFNPKSGGGKAERFDLAGEARSRGIEPVELRPGVDLEALVRDAVAGGADALAMAGGDGSQAIVAALAAELGLPYACIPAGTRNHFALDLGVDRGDVVGALDAFRGGARKRVDLAAVNGRVFVNNVSLGLYAEAVQREGYREAKLRTILDTLPEALGSEGQRSELSWDGPEGSENSSGVAILVSNNRYRLGRAVGSGTRPRIDEGSLGVAVAASPGARGPLAGRPWREWTTPSFEVRAPGTIAAGIDGEAATLEPPLRFESRPAALEVRVATAHPGASPSAAMPEGALRTFIGLVRIVRGGPPGTGEAAP